MFHCKILRKFLLPGRYALFGAAVAVTAEGEKAVCNIGKAIDEASKADSTCKHCEAPAKLRPSELPIYESPEPGRIMEVKEEEPSSLEKTICAVRKEVWAFYGQYKDCQQKVIQFVETGKAHSESTLSFLREEATPIHRAGAIGVSGIAGLIMGLRGGWFKRILYGATGATAMAALCYPRQSAEIADESLQMAKYYFTVAYNFIYGDEIPLPTKTEPENPAQQVEETLNPKKIPALKVTSEEIVTDTYSTVSATCSCPDPASGSLEYRYPSNSNDALDDLGEMMSDVAYWGFRFVSSGSPRW